MRTSNILRTQECPSFRLSCTFTEDSSLLFVSPLSTNGHNEPIQSTCRRRKAAPPAGAGRSSSSSGLKSVSKVLSVTLALTGNTSPPKTSFSANISSLAEQRQTCCGVTGRQSVETTTFLTTYKALMWDLRGAGTVGGWGSEGQQDCLTSDLQSKRCRSHIGLYKGSLWFDGRDVEGGVVPGQ